MSDREDIEHLAIVQWNGVEKIMTSGIMLAMSFLPAAMKRDSLNNLTCLSSERRWKTLQAEAKLCRTLAAINK